MEEDKNIYFNDEWNQHSELIENWKEWCSKAGYISFTGYLQFDNAIRELYKKELNDLKYRK